MATEEQLKQTLSRILLKDDGDGVTDGIDEDIIDYLASMLHDSGLEDIEESIGPFLESYGCDDELIQDVCTAVSSCGGGGRDATSNGANTLVVIGSTDKNEQNLLNNLHTIILQLLIYGIEGNWVKNV